MEMLTHVLLIFLLITGYQTQSCQRLHTVPLTFNQCTCPGDLLEYECTAFGSGTTKWNGSAFDCTNNRIVLRHSQFSGTGTMESCNGGAIVGYSYGNSVNNCFTSRLNVTVDSSLDGETISCTHIGGETTTVIGINTVIITSDQNPYPPPDNVRVVDINQHMHTGQLVFTWSSVTASCPSAHYAITSINCGICPETTNHNQVTCRNVTVGNTCSFVVRTVACGNVMSSPSRSVTVVLKVPTVHNVQSVPLYDDETKHLKSINTTFEESESFTISDGIDGSATLYTITYSNPNHMICSTTTIPASHCINGVCSLVLDVSSSNCSILSEVLITVFGTNLLGNGPTVSNSMAIGHINNFVRINFSLLTSEVICTFLTNGTTEQRCSVVYGPRLQCVNATLRSEGTRHDDNLISDSVRINLPSLPRHQSVDNNFCFIITASDGLNTVKVEGSFNAGCDEDLLSDSKILTVEPAHRCGAPLHSIGIENGVACFTGVSAGDTAIYLCSDAYHGDTVPYVRTCLPNGIWNGTIPHCKSATINNTNKLSLKFTISLSVGVLTATVLLAVLIVVVIILVRIKAKLQVNLRQAAANALYDEVGIAPSAINTSMNVAYSTAQK